MAEVDPFVFVAATRYAIRRTLTSASERVAAAVVAHAAEICRDMGATQAIVQEIEDVLPTLAEDQSWTERDQVRAAWSEALHVLHGVDTAR